MTKWLPTIEACRIRNGVVEAVAGGRATVLMDAAVSVAQVPIYGPPPGVGQGVLVLEQGGTLLVLGNAVSLLADVEELRSKVAAIEGRLRDGDS